ncbi:pilus assembly protein PilZ [Novosphingobium sp. AAP1]|nr:MULTISPECIES: PilZ domain-containing protein [unclassified Novosphingobium]KPF52559.1 pilus assembly protein PilZ [Novosphingobium sp. AAP1]
MPLGPPCWKRNLTVTDIDHRQLGRDSLFLMADLRLDGQDGEHRVRVRNLSAGGMMAEGALRVVRGMRLEANLRHIGWVEGVVAWVQDTRFGIAFVEQIDPKLAREPVATQPSDDYAPRYVRPPLAQPEGKRLRKL